MIGHMIQQAGRVGRPRSEHAREAVLHAVDDLLVDVGYAAMTMKGIAERAGVGRQTVYRWWSTKAEILLEACVEDAAEELALGLSASDPAEVLTDYVKLLSTFLVSSPAGLAYRALVGEAQHDSAVRTLVRAADVLGPTTREVLDRVRPSAPGMPEPTLAAAQLTGPILSQVLTASAPLPDEALDRHAATLLTAWR
jgi:AcrR family transcriptional regulator